MIKLRQKILYISYTPSVRQQPLPSLKKETVLLSLEKKKSGNLKLVMSWPFIICLYFLFYVISKI